VNAHPLDRPAWNSLTGPQAALAAVSGAAVRMDPLVGPFAATDGSAQGDEELVAAVQEVGGTAWLVETDEVTPPKGLVSVRSAPLTQMVAESPQIDRPDFAMAPLGGGDGAEMAELALATEPGPWCEETWRYGGYYGVRDGGRLVAMAGTRMRPAAHLAEVSGVCTDPAYRGRGLARGLMMRVMEDFAAEGATTFLHCYSANHGAIALYRSMGFVERRQMVVTVLSSEGAE
jgi:ribosomal protein S18 acetylase RimI-like enzyme